MHRSTLSKRFLLVRWRGVTPTRAFAAALRQSRHQHRCSCWQVLRSKVSPCSAASCRDSVPVSQLFSLR